MKPVSFLQDILPSLPGATSAQSLACLTVSGADSIKFLQGQTSCDFLTLTPEQALQGAVCNIKGRVIANFYALQKAGDIVLIMAKDLLVPLMNHLKKFAVFFKVELKDTQSDYDIEHVFSQDALIKEEAERFTCQALDDEQSLIALNQTGIKHYLYLRPNAFERHPMLPPIDETLTGLALMSGQAIIEQAGTEKFIPQMLNMQLTQGISFKKGCYTGQEIVARMQYRGNLKKHLYLLSADTEISLPSATKLSNQAGKEVAEVVNCATVKGHTLIHAIIGDESAQTDLFWQDTPLTLEPLPY